MPAFTKHRKPEWVDSLVSKIGENPTDSGRLKRIAYEFNISVQAIYAWRRMFFKETWVKRDRPLLWSETKKRGKGKSQ